MKTLQEDVTKLENHIFSKLGKTKDDPFFLTTNLSSEVGELADEVVGLEGERVEDTKFDNKSEAAKEVVDVIFNAIRIANHYGIDLSEYWEKRLSELYTKFE